MVDVLNNSAVEAQCFAATIGGVSSASAIFSVVDREDLPIAFSVVVRVSSSHLKHVRMLPTLCVGLCVFRRVL